MPHLDPRDQRIADQERRITELERLLTAALARIEKLEAENAELRAKLNLNSTNSSMPPSSDPPGVQRPKWKPTGRHRGAQPGHKGHKRELLPPEKVTAIMDLLPDTCEYCSGPLEGTDPDPYRRQIVEFPEVVPEVTELRIHALGCDRCGCVTRGRVPAGLPRGAFGPRLIATISLLTGRMKASKRDAKEFLSDVLGIDLSVGSISKSEAIVSDALAPAVEAAREFVHTQRFANLDESGWRENKLRAWIWIAATALVTVFQVSRSRGSQVAKDLLGESFKGIVGSDRWSAYTWIPLASRQICWAHLKRDFQKMADRGGEGARIGRALLGQRRKVFRWWAWVQDGTMSRETFQRRMRAVERRVGDLLRDGEVCPDGRVSGMCAEMLKVESALWTFVRVEGIEPTNNRAERELRKAVLWRKGCFGTDSETGSRYAERILTATTTLRKQDRHVLEFLTKSVEAAFHGVEGPSLLPVATPAQAAA